MHELCISSQSTSRMGTARAKQKDEADTRIIAREERNVDTKRKSLEQGLTSADEL